MYHDGKALPRRFGAQELRDGSGFTLVEVVIAIAVTSFVLISILGLMAYASQVVHQSDQNARLAVVSGQMLTTLSSESFYVSSTNTNAVYFTPEGLPTNSAGAYYQCNATNATPSGPALVDVFGNQLMQPMRIIIRWPAPAGSKGFANTNSIITSIFNYE